MASAAGSIQDINTVIPFREGILISYEGYLLYSDGTAVETEMIFSAKGELSMTKMEKLFTFRSKTYMEAIPGKNGYELWTTDGTLDGTQTLSMSSILPPAT